MPVFAFPGRVRLRRALIPVVAALLPAVSAVLCPAASIRGVVTDSTGAKVTGATVVLINKGKPVATVVSTADEIHGAFYVNLARDGDLSIRIQVTPHAAEDPEEHAAGLERDRSGLLRLAEVAAQAAREISPEAPRTT